MRFVFGCTIRSLGRVVCFFSFFFLHFYVDTLKESKTKTNKKGKPKHKKTNEHKKKKEKKRNQKNKTKKPNKNKKEHYQIIPSTDGARDGLRLIQAVALPLQRDIAIFWNR